MIRKDKIELLVGSLTYAFIPVIIAALVALGVYLLWNIEPLFGLPRLSFGDCYRIVLLLRILLMRFDPDDS